MAVPNADVSTTDNTPVQHGGRGANLWEAQPRAEFRRRLVQRPKAEGYARWGTPARENIRL